MDDLFRSYFERVTLSRSLEFVNKLCPIGKQENVGLYH